MSIDICCDETQWLLAVRLIDRDMGLSQRYKIRPAWPTGASTQRSRISSFIQLFVPFVCLWLHNYLSQGLAILLSPLVHEAVEAVSQATLSAVPLEH